MQGRPFNEGPLVLRWVAFLMVLAGIGLVLAVAPFAVLVLASIADGSDSGSSNAGGVCTSYADPNADDSCSGSSGYVDEVACVIDVRVLGPSGDDYDIQRRGQIGTTVEGCGAYTRVMLTVKGHAPIPMVPVLRCGSATTVPSARPATTDGGSTAIGIRRPTSRTRRCTARSTFPSAGWRVSMR